MSGVIIEGFARAKVISLSFIAKKLPPIAAILAELGIFKNSYVLSPPIWEYDKLLEKKIIINKNNGKINDFFTDNIFVMTYKLNKVLTDYLIRNVSCLKILLSRV